MIRLIGHIQSSDASNFFICICQKKNGDLSSAHECLDVERSLKPELGNILLILGVQCSGNVVSK